MSLAIILAFGAMVGWGVGDFLIQRTIKRIGWLETLWWIYLGSFIFLSPLVYKSFLSLNGSQILLFAILGLVVLGGAIAHFKALKIGKLSVVEIILFFELPLTVILGIIFLKNSLSLYQILVITLLFAGVVLISLDFDKMRRRQFWFFWEKTKILLEKGTWLAVLTAILLAFTNFLTAVGSANIDPLLAIWFPWTLGGIICFSYLLAEGRFPQVMSDGRRYWRLILIMAIVDISAWLLFSFSIAQAGELAIIASITESYIVIAMLLGLIFNKEKIRGWQYLGAIITIGCSLLLGLSS